MRVVERAMSEGDLAFVLFVVGAVAFAASLGWPWRTSE
jgi:hypothetical protein